MVCNATHLMDKTSGSANAFDCLETWNVFQAKNYLSYFIDDFFLATYCRRLTTRVIPDPPLLENRTTFNGQVFTFHQLRQMNVSAEQLLQWYAPMDIIEEYESGHETGLFVNCSDDENFWFGTHCQYTLNSADDIADIIERRIDEQYREFENILSITNGTCYIVDDDQCNSIICLDWREICDG